MAVISFIDAITMAMREEMRRDPGVFVLGKTSAFGVASFGPQWD